jgi:hypothetical protein
MTDQDRATGKTERQRAPITDFIIRAFKITLLFVVVGPPIGGVVFAVMVMVTMWGLDAAGYLVAGPIFSYFVGALPALIVGLGIAVAHNFIRQSWVTVGAGATLGVLTVFLSFKLYERPIHGAEWPFLTPMMTAAGVSALACGWIVHRLGWLERDR